MKRYVHILYECWGMLDTSDVQSVNARVVNESTIEIQCMALE